MSALTSPSTRSSLQPKKKAVEEVMTDSERIVTTTVPLSRVRGIMKHAEETKNISPESIHVMAKVAELFICHVSRGAHAAGGKGRLLEYRHVADYVNSDRTLAFMRDILPHKVTFRQYKALLRKKGVVIAGLDQSSSEGSSSSEEEGGSSSGSEGSSGEESDQQD